MRKPGKHPFVSKLWLTAVAISFCGLQWVDAEAQVMCLDNLWDASKESWSTSGFHSAETSSSLPDVLKVNEKLDFQIMENFKYFWVRINNKQ